MVDDRTVTAVSLARESYEFLMDKCVSDQVILTVRAVVRDDFGGIPSNRVVVYCKKPRLQLVTDVGYDYVAFRVTSEVATTVTCSLKSQFSAEILATRALKVHPVNVAPYQLFKSLYPDTEYTIECFGYDLDFNLMSGLASFHTLSNFVLPNSLWTRSRSQCLVAIMLKFLWRL